MTGRTPRLGIAAAALLLAGWTVAEHAAWRAARAEALRALRDTGTGERRPQIEPTLRGESDRGRLRLRLARALLADEHDRTWRRDLEADELARAETLGRRKLELSAAIAEETLTARTASWQAAMILGQARYLDLFRRGDVRLATEPELWHAPLELARRLAPGEPEPARLLAAAYLGTWSSLDAEARREAEALIGKAMEDPRTFALLIEPWLRAAPSRERAFAAVPARPEAWRQVQEIFAREGDWERFCEAWERGDRVRREALAARLEDVEARLEGGERLDARYGLRDVILRSRPDPGDAPLLAGALRRLPPGAPSGAEIRALRGWLDWALERCLYDRCALDAATLDRLSRAVGSLEPWEGAAAAIAAGDAARAERLERRAGALFTPEWRPYLLLKARSLMAEGKSEAALATLERLPPLSDEPLAQRRIRSEVRRAAGLETPGEPARREWPAEAWRQHGAVRRLELVPASPGRGLKLAIDWADGAAFEARWDGATLGCRGADGVTRLRLPAPVNGPLHLLELMPLHGRAVVPGRVELVER